MIMLAPVSCRRFLLHRYPYEIALAGGLVVVRATWNLSRLRFEIAAPSPIIIPLEAVHAVAGVPNRTHRWSPNWVPIDRCYLRKRNWAPRRSALVAPSSAF